MNNSTFMQYKKERLQTLIMEYEAGNPGFERGKKLVFNSLAVIIGLMIIDALCNIIHYSIGMDLEYLGRVVFPIAASLILASLLYFTGKKIFAYIMLPFAAYWLCGNTYLATLIPSALNNPNIPLGMFLIYWNIFRIIANVVQIAALIFILVNKKCKAFLGASARMHKQLRDDLGKFIA